MSHAAYSRLFYRRIIALLGFGGRDVTDGFEQPPMAEPVDPFERGVFDSLEAEPRATPMDNLGLVKAVDRRSTRDLRLLWAKCLSSQAKA